MRIKVINDKSWLFVLDGCLVLIFDCVWDALDYALWHYNRLPQTIE